MDGSHERQGVLQQLTSRPLPELREMLARQEQLLESEVLPRLPDGGARIQAMVARLRQLVAEREAREPPPQPLSPPGRPVPGGTEVEGKEEAAEEEEEEEEDEDEDVKEMRNILLRTSAAEKVTCGRRSLKFVPNRTRHHPLLEEKEEVKMALSVGEIADVFSGISLGRDEEAKHDQRVPLLSDEEWLLKSESVRPPLHKRQCPRVPRQSLSADPQSVSIVLIDILRDPSSTDGQFIQLCARKLLLSDTTKDVSTVDSDINVYCQPGYISEFLSKRSGLKVRLITSQAKTETSDAVTEPILCHNDNPLSQRISTLTADAALLSWWRFITNAGSNPTPSTPILLLLLPPPKAVSSYRQLHLSTVRKAVDKLSNDLLLLDLSRFEWAVKLRKRLDSLPRDLNPKSRCDAAADFLRFQLETPSQLWENGRVERLCDRLAALDWTVMRAANMASFQHRLLAIYPKPVISDNEAMALAGRGWNYDGLNRAFAAGWTVLVTALLSRSEAEKEEDVEVVRRLFRHFQIKFKKMELHRGELLADNHPITLRAQLGGVERKTKLLPLKDSVALTLRHSASDHQSVLDATAEQLRLRATTAQPAPHAEEANPGGFIHKGYRDPVNVDEDDEDEEDAVEDSDDSDEDDGDVSAEHELDTID